VRIKAFFYFLGKVEKSLGCAGDCSGALGVDFSKKNDAVEEHNGQYCPNSP